MYQTNVVSRCRGSVMWQW